MEPCVSVNLGTPNIVTVTGDLDLACVPLLHDLLARVRRGSDLVIDLGGVTFIDCAGLGALVTAHRRTQARGGTLRVAHVPPQVRRVLELTGVDLPIASANNPMASAPPRALRPAPRHRTAASGRVQLTPAPTSNHPAREPATHSAVSLQQVVG